MVYEFGDFKKPHYIAFDHRMTFYGLQDTHGWCCGGHPTPREAANHMADLQTAVWERPDARKGWDD